MKLKISPIMIVLAVFLAFTGKIQLFLSYLVAIAMHELAHAECAARLGYRLTCVRLTPFGASISGELNQMTGAHEWKIAVVGPLVSAVIFLFTVAFWWILPESYFFTMDFAAANLSLACFNLLPVYPLDGGRVLYALLRLKTARAYKIMRALSVCVAALCLIAFAACLCLKIINPTLGFTLITVFLSAILPEKRCKYQVLYDLSYRMERLRTGMRVRAIAVSRETTAKAMRGQLCGDAFTLFVVVDGALSVIPETELERASGEQLAGQLCGFKVKNK